MTLGEPVFIELAGLTDGHHRLSISGRMNSEREFMALGDLEVVVRESSPWVESTGSNGLLELAVEPPGSSLEELWDGDVDVSVAGPEGRQVNCLVEFYEDPTKTSIGKYDLGSMVLPVTAAKWRDRFEKRVMQVSSAQKTYDKAKSCDFRFKAGELGVAHIRCERDFTPLRWTTRTRSGRYELRLLDDEGGGGQVSVRRLAFEKPIVEEEVVLETAIDVSPSGGLYVASKGEFFVAKIMPPIDHSPKSLNFEPIVDELDRSRTSALELIAKSRLWRMARLPGDFFAARRRRAVLLALAQHIAKVICGPAWARAEAEAAATESDVFQQLRGALSRTEQESAIATSLVENGGQLVSESCQNKAGHLESLAAATGLLTSSPGQRQMAPLWLSEFALRVASDPGTVEDWAGAQLGIGVSRLMEIPALARAARFFVLTTSHLGHSRDGGSAPLAGWDWK